MTTEPTVSADLEELRRAELERREQRRQAREGGALAPLRARRRIAESEDQTGFNAVPEADEPAPRPVQLPPRVTQALQRVVDEAGEEPALLDRMLVRASGADDPLKAVAADAVELLGRTPPLPAVGHLVELAAGGLPVLTEEERLRAEALRSGRLPAPDTEPDVVDAWQLHVEAAEAQGRAVLSTDAWQRLVERLPLSVVDDLIDRGALRRKVTPHTWPEQSDRVRYVTARLLPWELDDAAVEALEWRAEVSRRTLWAGGTVEAVDGRHDEWSLRSALLGGDISALDSAESYGERDLPLDLADLVLGLRRIRRGAPVDGRLGRERSLFGLLEDCVPDERLISGTTAFHYWAGTRRLYRLVDDMHWAMACASQQTEQTVRAAVQQAAALRNPDSRGAAGAADREARAVQAYLIFLHARPGDRDRLDQGVGLLEDVLKRGGARRGGAEGAQRKRLRNLSELLQSLRLKSKPHDVLNPYLALCVEHDSTEWRQGWRDLRRQVAAEQLEYINGAKDRIQRIETARRPGEDSEFLYEIPLNEQFLWVPDSRSDVLQPGPQPLKRRSEPSDEQEQLWSATEAAREIIGRCAGRLRNDH